MRSSALRKTAICGCDLHLYDGYIPTMEAGDILGHEFMGIVEEVGPAVKKLKRGDRVVVPFTIACGNCLFCRKTLWSLCDNTNPNAQIAETMYGYTGSALFGYSHIYGGYAGGQAQYARVPFADVGPIKIENDLPDEKVLFLSDIFPTGYMGAENCNIQPGDTVAVWGCGPVGLFAIASAYMLGAEKVIAIDRFPERLKLAREYCGATTIDYTEDDVIVVEALRDLTGGIGPDGCIDAVGMEAHSSDGGWALRQGEAGADARDGSSVCSAAGDPGDSQGRHAVDSGRVWRRARQGELRRGLRQGHEYGDGPDAHAQVSCVRCLNAWRRAQIDPSFLISHRIGIEQAPEYYKKWQAKEDGITKIVIDPWVDTVADPRAKVA